MGLMSFEFFVSMKSDLSSEQTVFDEDIRVEEAVNGVYPFKKCNQIEPSFVPPKLFIGFSICCSVSKIVRSTPSLDEKHF